MGTRADFYIGRGESAEWLGSHPYDGYPDGIARAVLEAQDESRFREAVAEHLASNDGTVPEEGWPWPWENSQTTDYAYALDGRKVWASCFGHAWFDPTQPEPDDEWSDAEKVAFPDMRKRKNVAFGFQSGVLVFVAKETVG